MALLISTHESRGARNRLHFASSPRAAPLRRTVLASWLTAVFAFCVFGACPAIADGTSPKEYQIKAIFVFNFAQFVQWPDSAFSGPTAPIRIGILGHDPFGGALDAVIQGETLHGRPLAMERSNRLQDLLDCHVLFISAVHRAHVGPIVSACFGRPILTVGDMPDFARRGGIINFFLEDQKVRFEVNRAAAQRSGLKLSSQLLSLARIVGPTVDSNDR